jgi:hypothetical protein
MRHALLQHRATVVASLTTLVNPAGEPTGLWDIGPGGPHGGSSQTLQSEVLRLIQQRPEGIHPVDIGNQLGVDWRSTLGPAQALVDEGIVEQIGSELYPAGEGSRK